MHIIKSLAYFASYTHIHTHTHTGDSATRILHRGTDPGLSIVKQLVEAQGGTITAHSELGIGATFIFTLPLWYASTHTIKTDGHQNASWFQYALRQERAPDVKKKDITASVDGSYVTKTRRPSINVHNTDVNGCRSQPKGRRRHSLPWSPCMMVKRRNSASTPSKCSHVRSPTVSRGQETAGMWDELVKAKSEALFELNSKNMVMQELEYCLSDLQQLRMKTEHVEHELYCATQQHRTQLSDLRKSHERDMQSVQGHYETLIQQAEVQQAHQQGLEEQLQTNMRIVKELQLQLQLQHVTRAPSHEDGQTADSYCTEYDSMNLSCFVRASSSCSDTAKIDASCVTVVRCIDKMPWHSELKMGVIEIMSVDDTLHNHAVVERVIKESAYKMTACMDGAQALRIIEKRGYLPDVMLLDAMMPHMDGYEVCEQIRKRFSETMPVIMTSAKSENESITRALQCGCTDYVTKPYSKDVLLARIQARLRLRDVWADTVRALRNINTDVCCAEDEREEQVACNSGSVVVDDAQEGVDAREVCAERDSDWVERGGFKDEHRPAPKIGEFRVLPMMYVCRYV
jgi:DNA-binding response OmpR family regulator